MKLKTLFCLLVANIFGIKTIDPLVDVSVGIIHTNLIGGNESKPNQWPWHASLYAYDVFKCSATLISERWILTAAHCLFNDLNRKILDFRYGIRLGLHFLSIREPNEQMRNVSKSIVHPDFQYLAFVESDQLIPVHDLGLLQLATPVMRTNSVQSIPLANPRDNLRSGDSSYATGWGYIYQDIQGRQQIYNVTGWGIITTTTTLTVQPDALQQLELTIDSGKDCADLTLNVNDTICVASEKGGTGPCLGDSGGPLVVQRGKKWVLHGVSSFGPQPCAPAGITGIYTKVSAHIRWILNATQTY